VARATGRSLSDWQGSTRPLLAPGTYDRLVIEPEREALYAACDARVLTMLGSGAVEEVRALVGRGLDATLPAMKAVGVREIAAHLTGETTLAEATTAMQQATRNYAKRQLTWFRNQCGNWGRV
jgi:tRNA dimethylallyltransferase